MDRVASKKAYVSKLKEDNGKKYAAGLKKKYAPAAEAPDEEWAAVPETAPGDVTEPPLVGVPEKHAHVSMGDATIDERVIADDANGGAQEITDPEEIAAAEAMFAQLPEAPSPDDVEVSVGEPTDLERHNEPGMLSKLRKGVEAFGLSDETLSAIKGYLASMGGGGEVDFETSPPPERATLSDDEE